MYTFVVFTSEASMRYTVFCLLILMQSEILLSQEAATAHKLSIEQHYKQYSEAFSAQDVDLIESFFKFNCATIPLI